MDKSAGDKNELNNKTTQKQTQSAYTVTEVNKPNFRLIAEALEVLYNQGVRIKKPTSPSVGDKN